MIGYTWQNVLILEASDKREARGKASPGFNFVLYIKMKVGNYEIS